MCERLDIDEENQFSEKIKRVFDENVIENYSVMLWRFFSEAAMADVRDVVSLKLDIINSKENPHKEVFLEEAFSATSEDEYSSITSEEYVLQSSDSEASSGDSYSKTIITLSREDKCDFELTTLEGDFQKLQHFNLNDNVFTENQLVREILNLLQGLDNKLFENTTGKAKKFTMPGYTKSLVKEIVFNFMEHARELGVCRNLINIRFDSYLLEQFSFIISRKISKFDCFLVQLEYFQPSKDKALSLGWLVNSLHKHWRDFEIISHIGDKITEMSPEQLLLYLYRNAETEDIRDCFEQVMDEYLNYVFSTKRSLKHYSLPFNSHTCESVFNVLKEEVALLWRAGLQPKFPKLSKYLEEKKSNKLILWHQYMQNTFLSWARDCSIETKMQMNIELMSGDDSCLENLWRLVAWDSFPEYLFNELEESSGSIDWVAGLSILQNSLENETKMPLLIEVRDSIELTKLSTMSNIRVLPKISLPVQLLFENCLHVYSKLFAMSLQFRIAYRSLCLCARIVGKASNRKKRYPTKWKSLGILLWQFLNRLHIHIWVVSLAECRKKTFNFLEESSSLNELRGKIQGCSEDLANQIFLAKEGSTVLEHITNILDKCQIVHRLFEDWDNNHHQQQESLPLAQEQESDGDVAFATLLDGIYSDCELNLTLINQSIPKLAYYNRYRSLHLLIAGLGK